MERSDSDGKCSEDMNGLAHSFNRATAAMLVRLKGELDGMSYSLGNMYQIMSGRAEERGGASGGREEAEGGRGHRSRAEERSGKRRKATGAEKDGHREMAHLADSDLPERKKTARRRGRWQRDPATPARGRRDPLSPSSSNTICHGSSRSGFSPISINSPAFAGGRYGTQRRPVLS
ncbi:hypothetical protein ACLOJK_003820 [Asimina triloba]